jgi:hypothetical protein
MPKILKKYHSGNNRFATILAEVRNFCRESTTVRLPGTLKILYVVNEVVYNS